jgi:hypothetical protein
MKNLSLCLLVLLSLTTTSYAGSDESDSSETQENIVTAQGRYSPSPHNAKLSARNALLEKLEIKRNWCEDEGRQFSSEPIFYQSHGGSVRQFTAFAYYLCN